ncbi:hypothetical protein VSDG_09705 [Cytospora chrysosperma]|uniref:Vacuolar protein sorting/targeting protein 10 n=1 Tax=Cytospora chrysosperma TaxID=252740 RepID=A0A423VA78_CYTCH|nr:hypothetical protein VSDG_09705 [Valsa sordida]
MKARGATKAAALLLTSLWTIPLLVQAKDEPTFTPNVFAHYPQNLNYFDKSDVMLFQDISDQNVYRSPDGGATWQRVSEVPDGEAFALIMHEFNDKRAYIMTEGVSHYMTDDRGKTWKSFFTDAEISLWSSSIFSFHATDPDRIIFNGMDCQGIFCDEVTMYTTDGFRSDAKYLRGDTQGCWWAQGTEMFTTGQSDLDKQRVLCIVSDSFSPLKQDNRLVISDNFFSATSSNGVIQEFEPNLDTNRPVQGIVNVAAVKKYLLVATASLNTNEMALFVTDDTLMWHRAMFHMDHRIDHEAYTVLESTNYSIQIDVMTTRPSNPMGVMFTSNSNGTFFTRNIEHTNRNMMGHVDFEKIAGIQGIFLVNKVDNYDEVENSFLAEKKIISEITHDDGRTFSDVETSGGEQIHLHSVTQMINVGRVFSSPAPGLVMANGNTGAFLKSYSEGRLYISDDAGMHWLEGPTGPHKYEFGDQGNVLVAIHDSEKADVGEIKYSLNHGKDWKTAELPGGLKIKPWVLTTTPDSTSLKFILTGQTGDDTNPKFHVIAIDFEGLHERTCGESDMEDWWARVDEDGEPTCLMGHKQKYRRRKKNADCFIKQEFHLAQVETTNCPCVDADFECDYNFRREGGECVAAGPVIAPDGACVNAKPDDTFMGSSGWRLIPGNTCKRTESKQKDDLVERKCADSQSPPKNPASGKVESSQYVFEGASSVETHYLERGESSSSDDETIIAKGHGKIMMTRDGGKTWVQPEALSTGYWGIVPHSYFKEMVFFIKQNGKVTYTINRGSTFDEFQAPTGPKVDAETARSPLAFHPDKKDWIIWVGEKCTSDGKTCYKEASLSRDRGDNWKTIMRYVDRCEFTGSNAFNFRNTDQIICLAREREDDSIENNPWQLVGSNDFFDTRKVLETNVKDFATMSEFIVAATQNITANTLRAVASLDGLTFAEAHFPYNFEVPHQHAYTVLDSSTHAVNLFVATDVNKDERYGTIMRSNSNGTSYVASISGVNCDNNYYVDFEKMLGLEGVVMANIVANADNLSGGPKKLRTLISHNDGAEWAYLPPPDKDIDGKSTGCSGGGSDKCALHIHGYTERRDHSKTFSSAGAVGLMFGWGNVGQYLGTLKEADTYMTSDAGITWTPVKKGRWQWLYGDQGSIIVLVPLGEKTNIVSFTTDEGKTWNDYKFAEAEMEVINFSTQTSGVSRKFIVWTKDGDSTVATTIDFTGLADTPCEQKDDPNESDYRIWSPSHPIQGDDCLFGHVTQYMRKKTDRQCYNGYRIQHIYNVRDCTCSRRDYECDYNFELDNHGSCKLVKGLQPVDHIQWCKDNPDEIEYYEPTGYRKIPLSTCEGGDEFDKQAPVHPCPGKEPEFEQRHGMSGVGLFFAITIPFALAAAAGWYVYTNYSHKFGQIRLGESSIASPAGFGGGAFDSDSPLVRYPIMALSAAVAVAGAVPLVLQGLWRSASAAVDRWRYGSGAGGGWSSVGGGLGGLGGTRPFTTRDSFARGRGDYAHVDDDEGELLGEDSDEEV